MRTGEDLLVFRAAEEPARRSMALRMLDDGMGGRGWQQADDADLWELHDAAFGGDQDPVAVAATCPPDDGRRVGLVAVVVTARQRGRGIGQRIIEELCDALRARGELALVAAVPSDAAPALVAVQRAGLRPSPQGHAGLGADRDDLVWFGLEL